MTPDPNADPPTRLARRLGLADAVVVGMGAMIGAGIFAVIGPAAAAAGNALLIGLLIAAFVAWCNALSSAQLAALYPESGGTYVYGRRRLGPLWGFLAGWGFVVGKLASCAAMALTFASYAVPGSARPAAAAAVLALTAVNYVGVRKTVLLTRVILGSVLAALGATVLALAHGGDMQPSRLLPTHSDFGGVLESAGLWFFAFAGFARLATLGEEVTAPARTLPRAIPVALGLTLALYGTVAATALLVVDVRILATATAPLATAIESVGLPAWSPVVRIGAALASLGVLLSLIAGLSRTVFAMAANHDLPHALARVHPRYRVPHRAELAVGLLVAAAVLITDLRDAIGFSACTVLSYYAITNAAALTLTRTERHRPRWIAAAGLVGCAVLAVSLPTASVISGAGVLLAGAAVFALRGRA